MLNLAMKTHVHFPGSMWACHWGCGCPA